MLAFFAIGYFNKTLNLSWHIFPILILYPVWGIVQQYLVIALVAGNLQDLKYRNIGPSAIILTTALLFGLLHYPCAWAFSWMARSIFLLYGSGRDPFVEVFGKILN
jgi:hypothetical protein